MTRRVISSLFLLLMILQLLRPTAKKVLGTYFMAHTHGFPLILNSDNTCSLFDFSMSLEFVSVFKCLAYICLQILLLTLHAAP